MFLPISLVVCGNGPMDTSCVRHFLRCPSSSRIFDSAQKREIKIVFFFGGEINYFIQQCAMSYYDDDGSYTCLNELIMICTLIK